MKIFHFPLVKITIVFVLGIFISYHVSVSLKMLCCLSIVNLLGLLFLYVISTKRNKFRPHYDAYIYYFTFCLGLLTLQLHTTNLYPKHYTNTPDVFDKTFNIQLLLKEKLKSTIYNDRYIAECLYIDGQKSTGKILLNLHKNKSNQLLEIGKKIQLKTTLQKHKKVKNPNQFDYGKYLADKQIFAQIYSTIEELEISQDSKKDIYYYSALLHKRIIKDLKANNFSVDEMNVALALILGQRQDISSAVVQDYQDTGATHILSVSGLHVGYLMLFFTFLLKPLPNGKFGSLFKLFFIILALGCFAIVSGLSPPVLRSVVMFSLIAVSNHINRKGNITHTLLISIFLLLLFEPYFLWDIGFKLSYLALFFIVWLQPTLKNLLKIKNKFGIYFWDIFTVSIAAQIGTLPLCLYYFHQFPGLFFITNIVIIPVLTIVMILGIVVMVLAFFNANLQIFVLVLEKMIFCLNSIIHYFATFRQFVLQDISFNNYYMLTLYLFIIAIIYCIKSISVIRIYGVLISLILFQTAQLYTKYALETSEELIIYNDKKHNYISERRGKNLTFYSQLPQNDSATSKILKSYKIAKYIKEVSYKRLDNTLFFAQQKILILDTVISFRPLLTPDILVLINTPKINLDRAIVQLKPKLVIANGSNSYSTLKHWKESCLKNKISFYSTVEEGFYKLENTSIKNQ